MDHYYFAFPGIIEFASYENTMIEFGRRRGSRDKKKRARKAMNAVGRYGRSALTGATGLAGAQMLGNAIGSAATADKSKGESRLAKGVGGLIDGGAPKQYLRAAAIGAGIGAGGQALADRKARRNSVGGRARRIGNALR